MIGLPCDSMLEMVCAASLWPGVAHLARFANGAVFRS